MREPADGYVASNLEGYRGGRGKILGPYSLRKACGTWLIESGADVKTVMEALRHADPRTTLKLYTGLRIERQRQATEDMVGTVLAPKPDRECPRVSLNDREAPNAGANDKALQIGINAG